MESVLTEQKPSLCHHHEVSMSFPCWSFCLEDVIKLQLVVLHQVLLQLIDTVAVLSLNK